MVKKRQPEPDAKGDPGPVALPMGGENKKGLDDRPHPGLLPREKEKGSPRLGKVVRRDWPDELPADRKLTTVSPLLGERKQVREVVKQIKLWCQPGPVALGGHKETALKFLCSFLRQRAVLQTTFIRTFLPAPVDDGRFANRSAHRPVEQSVFFKVDECFLVEGPFKSVRANVANQLQKKILINPLTNDVFVRPLRHRLGESPFCFAHEIPQFFGERIFSLFQYSIPDFSRTSFDDYR